MNRESQGWKRTWSCAVFSLLWLGGAAATFAANADPDTDRVIRTLSDYFRHLKTLSLTINRDYRVTGEGLKSEVNYVYNITVARPNKVNITMKSGSRGLTLVCDGEKLYSHVPGERTYRQDEAPADFDALFEHPLFTVAIGPLFMHDVLLRGDPYRKIMEDVIGTEYKGKVTLDGHECHHVKLNEEELIWEMWVDEGERPLPRKVLVDVTESVRRATRPQYRNLKAIAVFTFENWQTDQPVPDAKFAFSPPEGTTLFQGFRGPGRFGPFGGPPGRFGPRGGPPGWFGPPQQAEPEEEPADPKALLGKPAPSVTIPLLDRSEASPADHQGKEVVVLGFWNNRSNAGRDALTLYSKLGRDYAGKSVVVYGIGSGDMPLNMIRYAENKKMDCKIGLDFQGRIAHEFQAKVPTVVVIDKFGVVQSIRSGSEKELEQKARADIDATLSGKHIAPKGKIEDEAVGEI